jgi:hypothetical protein
MGMLDAVRQASHVLGAHPESFSNFSLNENKLTFRSAATTGSVVASHPDGRPNIDGLTRLMATTDAKVERFGQRFVDSEFDLADGRAVYRGISEVLTDKDSGEEYSTGGFSPEAQRRVHGRDLLWRENKWVPTPLKQDEP